LLGSLSQNRLGAEGAAALAPALAANVGLTRVYVRHNNIAGDGAAQLAAAVLGNLKIEMFNEIPIKEMRANSLTELDLNGKDFGVEGGMVIAGLIPVMGALTSVDLKDNQLGDEGWGAIFAAICGNKDSKIMSLDASSENISPDGVKLIAEALRTSVTGGLTVANLLGNQLDAESAKMLAKVAKLKGISLCGIHRNQTTADFSRKRIEPPDVILLASDLSQAVVTGGLTKLSLARNHLEEEGTKAICEALEQNTTLKELDIRGSNIGGSAGAKHVAKMVGINGGLTSIDLSRNQLCGIWTDDYGNQIGTYTAEGITAIADALRVNGALTSLNLSSNDIGGYWDDDQKTCVFTPVGPKAIADALLVNGALTSVELRGNKLGDEGWGAIFAAICGNKDSKIMSLDASSENISPAGGKLIAEALRTSVTGGLTKMRYVSP
jgi:Ran GTPase-activating protein (RanGAP) involved in mRNA processing and transport